MRLYKFKPGLMNGVFEGAGPPLRKKEEEISLTHSAAPSPAFESGVKKRRSGSTLSKPQHLCWGVEGLTLLLNEE